MEEIYLHITSKLRSIDEIDEIVKEYFNKEKK